MLILSWVATSTSPRKIGMCLILIFGTARSCARMENARRSEVYAMSVCATHCDFIMRKPAFSVGGIIECSPFRKIAVCVSMLFSPAKGWQRNAAHQGSIAICAKEKNLPITRRFGPNLKNKKTPNPQLRTRNAEFGFEVGPSMVGVDGWGL